MKKIIIIACAVVVVAVMVIRLMMPGDEKRIVKTIATGRAAIEAEDIDKLMSIVALAYRDEYGLSYAVVRRSFADMFRNVENIRISCPVRSVEIAGDTAAAMVHLSITGVVDGQRYHMIGRGNEPEEMTLTLARGELSWKVVSSKWKYFPSVEALMERGQLMRGSGLR